MKRDDYLILSLIILLSGLLIVKRGEGILRLVYEYYPIAIVAPVLYLLLTFRRLKGGEDAHLVRLLGKEFVVLPFILKETDGESLSIDLMEEVAKNMGIGISLLTASFPRKGSSGEGLYAGFLWTSKEGGIDLLRAGLSAISSVSGMKFEELRLSEETVGEIMRALYSMPRTEASFKEIKLSPVSRVDPPFLTVGVSPSSRPVRINLGEITKHVAVIGQTGSGKTTTVKRILWELWLWGIPFIVLDFHWEYREFVASLGGVVMDRDNLPCINPLSKLSDMATGDIYLLSEMLSNVLELTPSQFYIVSKSLLSLREKGSSDLRSLLNEIEGYREESQPERESKASLLRKLTPIVMSDDFKYLTCDNLCFDELKVPAVVELGYFKSDKIRQLFVHFMLKRLRDVFLGRGRSTYPRLVVVFEESEKILPNYRDSTGLTAIDRLLSEMRKFGLSAIVVTQAPSEVSAGVIRNTGIKIIHRSPSQKDIKTLKSLIDSKDLVDQVGKLREGEVLIVSSRVDRARVIPVDEPSINPKYVEDYIQSSAYLLSC